MATGSRGAEGKGGCKPKLFYRCLVDGCDGFKFAGKLEKLHRIAGDAAEARKRIDEALQSGEEHRVAQARAVQKAVVWGDGEGPEEPLTCEEVRCAASCCLFAAAAAFPPPPLRRPPPPFFAGLAELQLWFGCRLFISATTWSGRIGGPHTWQSSTTTSPASTRHSPCRASTSRRALAKRVPVLKYPHLLAQPCAHSPASF